MRSLRSPSLENSASNEASACEERGLDIAALPGLGESTPGPPV
jgi:hypothetical protein